MTRYHVTISGHIHDMMLDLVQKHKINIFGNSVKKATEEEGEGYDVDGFVEDHDIKRLENEGYKVNINHNIDEEGKKRQQEIGQQNRYAQTFETKADRSVTKTDGTYLNTDEVESAIKQATSSPNNTFTELITLPHSTWEGRRTHAIRIGKRSEPDRIGVYFIGGVHAREWGSSDILINFVEKVSQAYQTNSGLSFGEKNYSAKQIQDIIEKLDIFIFPQVNPDGRHYIMTSDTMWRKNRRPGPSSSSGRSDCIGVDINRNYNFLWKYPEYFSSKAAVQSSTDPCDYQVYIGPEAASEPETKNVIWIMDEFKHISFFVDIHSYGEDILYNWGEAHDQTTNPHMNFQNSEYDGTRGHGAYKEYIPKDDESKVIALAKSMASAIQAVRGRKYTVEEGYSLYPTSGTSDDYAFSRCFVNNTDKKIISYTIEWGRKKDKTFHPPYSEMQKIIQEITSGLIQFCIDIVNSR
ncbi:MAG: M14 family metallopeptidase [Candidatus Nitrosocosmicus sp.]